MTGGEGGGDGPRSEPKFEILKPKQAFEILFPNYPFANLPAIDVRSAAQIPIEFIAQTYFDGSYLFKAKDAGEGYARRVDLPYLDKVTARALLIPAFLPFASLPKPYEIRDVITTDEEIGGGVRHVFSAPNLKALDINFDINQPMPPNERSMYANIIGIMKKIGHKPSGLLIYLPGPRTPKPQREKILIGMGISSLIPVHS